MSLDSCECIVVVGGGGLTKSENARVFGLRNAGCGEARMKMKSNANLKDSTIQSSRAYVKFATTDCVSGTKNEEVLYRSITGPSETHKVRSSPVSEGR